MAIDFKSIAKNVKSNGGDLNNSIKDLNDLSIFKATENLNNVLDVLGKITNAAEVAALAVGSVFEVASVIDSNLKNSLEHIQFALENLGIAAYESFQEPMQTVAREAAGYINELTASITSGVLAENFDKVVKGMSDLASAAIILITENILPSVINDLALLMDKGRSFIVIIGGITSAVIAYKTAVEGVVIAQKALAAIISFSWVGLVAGAIAGLTTVIGACVLANKAHIEKMSEGTGKYDEQVQAVERLSDAYNKAEKSAEGIVKQGEEEAAELLALKNLLDKNVDAEGNIVTGYEAVKSIIEEINEIYPEEINLLSDKIDKYDELSDSIDNYAEKIRDNAVYESKLEVFKQAAVTYDESVAKNDDLYNAWQEAEAEAERFAKKYDFFKSGINRFYGWDQVAADEAGKSVGQYLKDMYYSTQGDLEIAKAAYEDNLALIEKSEKDMEDFKEYLANRSTENNKNDSYDTIKSPVPLSVEAYIREREEEGQRLTKEQEKNTRKLQNAWTNLNHQYAIGEIKSDEELYAKKLEAWNNFGNKYNRDHWKYYEELYKYEQDAAEKNKQDTKNAYKEAAEAQKQAIQEKWDTISKQEKLGLISSEEAYKRQLALIEQYCPEYADEWYSYYQTILDYQRDALREQVQGVRDSISDIVSEYQTEFSKIEDSISSYKNRLLAVESVFTVKTETDGEGSESKTYTVENMTKQMEKMQKYHNLVKNLKDRGVSSEVLSELTAFDFDDGMVFAENLAKSSDEELEKITALYAERDKLAEDLANELYAPEMDKLNEELLVDITAQFGTLPEEIRAIGGQSLAAFAEGLLENKENLTEAAQEFMNSFFEACDEGISSGSVGMANVGENIAAMLAEQDTYSIGYESGSSFAKGLSDALDNINDAFSQIMSGHADVSASLITSGQTATVNYGAASWSGISGSNKTEKIILENKDEITVRIDKDVLGKAMREYTKEYERRTGT